MSMTPSTILRAHKLRQTDCRRQVLNAFLEKSAAIGQPELEKKLSEFDRVTIYRTLTTFLEKGVLHKVLNDKGAAKYALCSNKCDEHQHHDEHVHFKCLECGELECIDNLKIPTFTLPKGYTFVNANLLIQGHCKMCVGGQEL